MRFLIKYSFITLFISIATAIYLLCCTTPGLVFELRYLTSFLPGTFQVDKIRGTLFKGFSLEAIHYQTKEEDITVKSLMLSWHPEQLLQGKLSIGSLILEQPNIILLSTDAASSTVSLDDFKKWHRINIHQLIVHQLKLQKADLRLDLTGELNDQWNFHWKLLIPTLKTVCKDCLGSFQGEGNIAGKRFVPTINAMIEGSQIVTAQQRIGKLMGDAHIVLQPKQNSTIHLVATQLKINDNLIKKIAITLTGNMDYVKNTLVAQAKMNIAQNGTIDMAASLPEFSGLTHPKQAVLAAIQLNFTNLEPLTYLLPVIQHPRGVLQGTLNITGTVSKPKWTGVLNLKQGHVAIHDLGIHLNDILLTGTLDKTNKMVLSGSFRSAAGHGQVQGDVDLNSSQFPLALSVQGSHLNLLHLPKYKIAVSPDVKINFIYPNLELQGKVKVTKATIKLKNYINTVALPDETVYVGETKAQTPSILAAIKLHIALDLGDDVYFSYKDFETNLGGQLVIDQAPNRPATAIGEIHAIKGSYTMYGQSLKIKTGRLIFAGNLLTNPGLNIEAIRRVKSVNASSNVLMPSLESYVGTDTIVGVRIIGTAENPHVTLFSIPAGLSQEQILSSLGGEGAALMGAISALNPGVSKVSGMTDKLTKMLGLTEVNITSVQTFDKVTNQVQSTPSFVIGKRISKKLSLHYSVGIFNPVSVFNVRYQINKNWAIQSETSTIENGADILYGFERP